MDFTWSYQGDDRDQVLYQRLHQIQEKFNDEKIAFFQNHEAHVKAKTINVLPTHNPNEFSYFFEICGVENYAKINKITITSDIKTEKINLNYFSSPRACLNQELVISANNPDTIRIQSMQVEQVTSFTDLQNENSFLKKKLDQKNAIIMEQIKVIMGQVQTITDLVKNLF